MPKLIVLWAIIILILWIDPGLTLLLGIVLSIMPGFEIEELL